MKHYFRFYAVDSLTETVLGGFEANNPKVAIKILEETVKKNEKLQLVGDNLKLCCFGGQYDSPETYDEIIERSKFIDFDPIVFNSDQKVLNFDGEKNE